MTPEGKVKKAVKQVLQDLDAYYFLPVSNGMGSHGVPDVIACIDGLFVAIECKAGNNQPTALQDYNLNQIRKAGGVALVVWDDTVKELECLLRKLRISRRKS